MEEAYMFQSALSPWSRYSGDAVTSHTAVEGGVVILAAVPLLIISAVRYEKAAAIIALNIGSPINGSPLGAKRFFHRTIADEDIYFGRTYCDDGTAHARFLLAGTPVYRLL